MLIIFTDGASSGNPGPGWAMWVVKKDAQIEKARVRLDHCTNNEAEYLALIHALKYVQTEPELHKNESTIFFKLDSLLVVKQVNGEWKIKDARMRDYVQQVHSLVSQLKTHVSITHIPREKNLADSLKYD